MTSRFETSMKKANDAIFEQFKETEQVTFTPKTGDAFQTEISLGPIDGDISDDEMGEMSIKTRRITIPEPEVTVSFADGLVTIAGEDWVVTEPGSISSGYVDLQCRWNKAQSKHHETHKRKAT